MTIRIALDSIAFGEKEKPLVDAGGFRVSTFRYDTSIAAQRIANRRGEIIVLPFKGHQIWRARFDGRDLTMKSMFDQPVDTRNYLETYGAFSSTAVSQPWGRQVRWKIIRCMENFPTRHSRPAPSSSMKW